MTVEKITVDDLHLEELACYLMEIDIDQLTDEYGDNYDYYIWEKLENNYGVYYEGFKFLIERLLPIIEVARSPLTNTLYKGFADRVGHNWLAKSEIKE